MMWTVYEQGQNSYEVEGDTRRSNGTDIRCYGNYRKRTGGDLIMLPLNTIEKEMKQVCKDYIKGEDKMNCYECKSKNIMERKGIANDHHDYVCLDCGHTWKPTNREIKK